MGSLLTAMVQGALIGGGVAAVTGGDIGKGLLFGAAGGGLGSAVSGGVGAAGGAAGGVTEAGMLATQTAGFTSAELAGWGAAAGDLGYWGASAGLSGGALPEGIGLKMSTDLGSWGSLGSGAVQNSTAEAAFAPRLTMANPAVAGTMTQAGMNTFGGAATGGLWGSVKSAAGQANEFLDKNKNLINVGTGVYGVMQAQAIQEQARLAQEQANLWANSGGQALGVAQLQQLMQDPSQTAANDPAYKLRIRSAQRAMAGYGQNSGAMAAAGANASTDWYNQRMAQLAGVAGANMNPAAQQQAAIQQQQYGNNLMGQSLATVGYGLGRKWGE